MAELNKHIVFDKLSLFISPERFVLQPLSDESKKYLVIDRVTEDISLSNDKSLISGGFHETIFGIWGVIQLSSGLHLIVIKERKCVGDLFGHLMWKITKSEIYPFARSTLHLTEEQKKDNDEFLSMLNTVLNTEGFYYSTSYDLTHSMQRLCETSPEFLQMSLLERADERFVWNQFLLRAFAQQRDLHCFCIPIMHGFVCVKSAILKERPFDYILISRRSRLRAGVRYYMRGVDNQGFAANNVETEQIVQADGHRFSYVQTRGSVPLYWSQYPNLLYKPKPKLLLDEASQREAFEKHFTDQIYAHQYGQQVIVSLLDEKGAEKKLNNDYSVSAQNAELNNVMYVPFDFHHECRKMQWHRLSILVDRVAPYQDAFGFLHLTPHDHATPLATQTGVFRTNCIDCLDRTNVAQSLFARRSLNKQLQKIGWLSDDERLESFSDFEFMFKNVWADNADFLALQYTGTGALKTDFTRTGQRTTLGAVRDAINSTLRYIYNNFYDGHRQDAIDLFLGNWVPDRAQVAVALRRERDWKTTAIPLALIISAAMVFLCVLLPPENWTEQAMYLLFWGSWFFIGLMALFFYGVEFVDRPRLALKIKAD